MLEVSDWYIEYQKHMVGTRKFRSREVLGRKLMALWIMGRKKGIEGRSHQSPQQKKVYSRGKSMSREIHNGYFRRNDL